MHLLVSEPVIAGRMKIEWELNIKLLLYSSIGMFV